ncbi:MAG: M14 family metallopeptidase [Bacillota bacterium]
MAITVDYHRFYQHAEIKAFLDACVSAYPHLAALDVIGQSYERRDIYVLEITNRSTGAAADKPAMYIDANIHAGEVTGSQVCLHTIAHLLNNYGTDPEVTYLLDTRAFYILPRVNPDGAELYLTTPFMLRSSVRPYPDEEVKDGLHLEDVDGNGMILQMRVPDETGEWKVSSKDPRLMVRRQPDDYQGTFYRIYPEGRIRGDAVVPVKVVPPKWGLDINRNFPANWRLEQSGAGPYPLSEPETRAMAEFILSHENIAAIQAYHTTGGVIFRAYCTQPDDKMDRHDLAAFKAIGRRGEDILGYECIPASHGGWGHTRAGIFIDWVYEHRGLIGYTTELWDMAGRAGLDKKKPDDQKTPKDVEEEQLKLLQWQDEHLEGKGFVPWTPFQHPDLGNVEIGGWVPKTVRQNAPPGKFLEEECIKNCTFTLKHAAATPLLKLGSLQVSRVATGVYKVAAVVKNVGYLPTSVTKQAVKAKVVKPIVAELQLPQGAAVVGGKSRVELEHLDGWVLPGGYLGGGGTRETQVEWTVQAPAGTGAQLVVQARRAGTVKAAVEFE